MRMVLDHSRNTSRNRRAARALASATLLGLLNACGGGDGATPVVPPEQPPPQALTAVTVSPSSVSLTTGATRALAPSATTGGAGVNVSYSYSSSQSGVATVSASGVITAVSPGSASITVTASGSGTGFTASTAQATVAVTVTEPPAALTALVVTPDSLALLTGSSSTLSATPTTAGAGVNVSFEFSSSAPAVATVSDSGIVTAVAPGNATISVTATGSGNGFATTALDASSVVTVRNPPDALTGLSVSPGSVALVTGGSQSLTVTPVVADNTVSVTVAYSTSAATVATVSESGVVTAVSPGSAVITVTATGSGSGFTTTMQETTVDVIVNAPPNALTSVELNPANSSLLAGGTVTLTPVVTTAGDNVNVSFAFRSSAPSVATVDINGVVTAIATGTSTITVEASGSGAGFTANTREATSQLTVTVLGVGFGGEQFSLIPAGSFEMGSANGESIERPVRTVTISAAFLMQKTEVTQAQWRQVMQGTALENPSFFTSCGETCPVDQVSWDDIQIFLQRLNTQDAGKNYRLATEAEWEYAARAGSTGDYAGNGVLNDMGWWQGNANGRSHAVATKLPNAWGIFDMHGNVREWVNDWFSAFYYASGPAIDPPGPTSGTERVRRGGSWGSGADGTRSASRDSNQPNNRSVFFGFRIVRTP